MTKHRIHRTSARAGFTLMEILIALSIFGVGLAMAAALFPAAVGEHEKAVEYTLSTMMCNNAIAQAKSQLVHYKAGTPLPQATTIKGSDASGYFKFPSDTTDPNPYYKYKVNSVAKAAGAAATDNSYDIVVEAFKGGNTPVSIGKLTIRTPLPPAKE